ncbi:unnamed protein product [Adineta steineri]|uniref:Uncharacterized protein n=1 Tax=Adineta steineri TaxID=433720 RepID=A0A818QLJ6_9BILA|nr:unnamed protein product [Adineta steineri]CAF1220617.1 unnamed protein product [Adineta steineri]CAF3638945.1 unnamed protein product [Adineta steineri]CAF3959407.1 unnamed protein product [Adineta steineri]
MVKFANYFLRFQNSYYGNIRSANSSCPTTDVKWCIDGFDEYKLCIENPSILPTCILALMIGLFCSKRISQLPGEFPSRWYYHLTFFLYGIMMSSAGILHCFLNDDTKSFTSLAVAIIDVGLTSNIAVSFLFCGLCDIQFLNPKSATTRWLLFTTYSIIFILWTFGLTKQWSWAFNVLYTGVVSVCCFIYLITQLSIKSKHHALPALFVGGLYGAIGLLAGSFGADAVCKSEGPFWSQYFGPEFIWFLFSDISVAFMFLYVIRANREQRILVKTYPIDFEKYPGKL